MAFSRTFIYTYIQAYCEPRKQTDEQCPLDHGCADETVCTDLPRHHPARGDTIHQRT